MEQNEGMMTGLERITPWWDRRVMGGVAIAVLPVTGIVVAVVGAKSEASVSGILLVVTIWWVVIWAVRHQIVPSASVSATTLVIKNVYDRYQIPWQMLSGIDWQRRSGVLSLGLADGQRVTVEAFSRWPSFGRHRKVIAILEEGRRLAATGQGGTGADSSADQVRITENSGILEFLLAVAFGITALALVVRGVILLLN
ncbi:hypothetical protein ACIHFB_43980 [Streptomyces sp. NPDC051963]|uniref:hypothetical protein n=1 Tax=Streptomyces sp. NPDC051963 TaxID=3365678 RepID=UPI0037D65797